MSQHDLFYFFQEANRNIESEYKRICASVAEDPGTAGDQGEENWKKILEQWLPPYFHIETKGRILFENGETSPQVDIVVLSPEYPKQLWGCKKYISGGVVAAFECKTTLRKEHIDTLIQTSKIIKDHSRRAGTPWRDLHSGIYYGMLAHSHSWKAEKSQPNDNINNSIIDGDQKYLDHPCQMPDIICVADLAVWSSARLVIPKQPKLGLPMYDHDTVKTSYLETTPSGEESLFTPVGAMVFHFLNYLAWDYPGLRNIVAYMRNLNVNGSERGIMREWDWSVFSKITNEMIRKRGLINGVYWNEWSMVQN